MTEQGNRRWAVLLVAALLLTVGAAKSSPAQKFEAIFNFDGNDGRLPDVNLVQGLDGNLYGTAQTGGIAYDGTMFKISSTGRQTILYQFCRQAKCTDGAHPYTPLVETDGGELWGTTTIGGDGEANPDCGSLGCGTVFKISYAGDLTTIYSFCTDSDCPDGTTPAGLIQAADGNFYGVTGGGGTNNSGTVFRITSAGTLTTLYNFCAQAGCTDGSGAFAALVQGTDGNFYGTTYSGGNSEACRPPAYASGGCGTVFKITPGGTLTTLHTFCTQMSCADGSFPLGLIQGTDGDFYGTTQVGGIQKYGAVFKITANGTLTTLYSFCSQANCSDGSEPFAGLAQGMDGNFYGTTFSGGTNGLGTVFRVTPSGTLTTLYSFDTTGRPEAALVQDTDGDFYGTTTNGGEYGYGSVFALGVGLGQFVEPLHASGKVGGAVSILGTDLTGATSVSFNGTAATFTVVSPSLINATVPEGATSGFLKITTPGGTLSSNVPFRVVK